MNGFWDDEQPRTMRRSDAPDLRGASLPDAGAVEDFLRAADCLPPGDEVLLVVATATKEAHRTHVLVSSTRLALVRTQQDAAPQVYAFTDPKALELRAEDHGATSTLLVRDEHRDYAVRNLGANAAHRVKDMVRLMRTGRLVQPDAPPDAVAFEGVYPITYYEALLGPNARCQITSVTKGSHRVALDAVVGINHGCFVIRHFVQTENGEEEIEAGWRPFRNNPGGFMREGRAPYTVRVVPATREPPDEFLAKHGITRIPDAATVAERYRIIKRRNALQATIEALEAAGLRRGDGPRGFRVLEGNGFDYLHVGGHVVAYDKDGDPVQVRAVGGKP